MEMTPGELPLCLINSVTHLPCFVLFYCFQVVTTPWHPIQHPFLFHYPALKLPIRAHGCGVRNRESLEPLKRDGDLQKGRGLGSNRKDQRAEGKTPCRQRSKNGGVQGPYCPSEAHARLWPLFGKSQLLV